MSKRYRQFRELNKQDRLLERLAPYARIEKLAEVDAKGKNFPIYSVVIGTEDKSAPTFGLFGGVHGLEKVGSHVVINHLKVLSEQLAWDDYLKEQFKHCRIVSIPIINPGGMFLNRRSNPNGIDLMRNSPVDAEKGAHPLVSGHRRGNWLPWYRGEADAPMELEAQTLVKFVEKEMFQAKVALALDVHSGFGMIDRLWFPYAKTKTPHPLIDLTDSFTDLLNKNLPYNVYKIETQSDSYLINGDVWDYIYDRHLAANPNRERVFIPWTLEMGSWLWMRKNIRQALSRHGIFNPILPHRYNRAMRRHRNLLNFFQCAVLNAQVWVTKET